MNVSEIETLVQQFRDYIPRGRTKSVTMKCCMILLCRMKNFEITGKLLEDLAEFDDFFYNRLCNEWCEGMWPYSLDDPNETFPELFAEFRYAAHRAIANYDNSTQQMQAKL